MHPPAFETIPELAPVLEYTSAGANTTNNYNTTSPSSSFPRGGSTSSSSSSSLHPQPTLEYTPLGRVIPRRSFTAPSPSTTVTRSQLPPLNTALPPPIAAYPMYPGLQTTPSSSTSKSTTSTSMSSTTTAIMSRRGQEPKALNRPRKISTSHARDSSSASARSSSSETSQQQQQGMYSTTQQQQLYQQQQQYRTQYQSPTSAASPTSTVPRAKRKQSLGRAPDELFGTLPGEVLEVILECLKELHLDPRSTATSCATCWTRDLCSLSLASRAWSRSARLSLYQDVQILGDDSAAHRKRFKMAQGCRMTLLRRTLRSNHRLAATVRSLRLPTPVGETCETTPSKAAGGLSPREVYENRVASLVMACPNLEVLAGPLAAHDHDAFSRITHALSTRTKLKTMNWRIAAADASTSSGGGGGAGGSSRDLARPGSSSCGSSSVFSSALASMLPPPLDAAQETRFLGHHRAWAALASLSVHCQPGASLAPATLLQRTLTCLPSLQHLHLSCVPANAFADASLLALPALRSLTLSHVPGISSRGLSAFATRPNSRCLRSLQLRHTPLTSLPALARLLSHLPCLASFALVQDFAPLMPSDDDAFALWMMPYLASRTVTRLHWDVVARQQHRRGGGSSDADDILARSIAAGGFPALRTLRAPNDPDGLFQQLCRPLEAIASSADRIWANGGRCGSSHSRGASTGSGGLAQVGDGGARLDDARPRFRFQVQVRSEEGHLVDEFGLGGFVGTVGSPIDYWLHPDLGSSDAAGGLVDVPDLAAPGGEALLVDDDDDSGGGGGRSVSGCTGSWNWREGVVADKREKEKWWHTERGRWIRPRLD
ncbi:hypothetical protein LEL_01322 [Akanthomyces lecanii RCEF 1005]|uniref:F-box domain-containing protein n=1 Tax=Akanthomyces lecanii RCEF 1005 TaxID=1081108 RepID=A0A168KJB8_CORDF|nr:hypothetical protein LEL_01322 [Akanthomyces lecanii RCEF 1005]